MNAAGLLLAVLGGSCVSCLPLLSWWQGDGLSRQMWMFILGHLLALPVVAAVAVATGWDCPSPLFFGVAMLSGACSGLNGALYYAGVMPRGPMAVSWAIVWLSAIVVAMAGWVFLHEPMYLVQPVAVACFVGCLVVMARATGQATRQAGAAQPIRRGYWFCLFTAMGIGVAGTILIKLRPAGGTDLTFVSVQVIGLATALLVSAIVLKARPLFDRRTLGVSLLWGAAVGPLYICIVWGLRLTDASVYTPTQAGTALVLGVAWAALRGERSSRLVYIGAALALLSIVLINLQGPMLVRW